MPDFAAPSQPAPESVTGRDEPLYELQIEGAADVVQGPLARFLDLAEQVTAEGGVVPLEIRDVLDRLASAG